MKTFLAVVETGSFASAALAIRRTQSSVTVQIRSLENDIGVELFDRSKRPPLLSDAGQRFVDKAKEAVRAYDRLFEGNIASPVQGNLVLGVVPSVITGIMPRALTALRVKYPELHLQLSMGLSADLVERVRTGELDAAIISDLLQGGTGIEWVPLLQEPLVLIAPPGIKFETAEKLVTSSPFIRYTRQAWVGELIDNFLKRRQLKVSEYMVLDTLEAITTMVHHGLGVSVVPQRGEFETMPLPVRRISFAGKPTFRTIGLVNMRDHPKSSLISALLQEIVT